MLPREVTIGANVFFIHRFAPFDALEVLGDLQQRFAAPLLEAMGKPGDKPASLDPNPLLAAQAEPQDAGEQDVLGAILRGVAKISAGMNGRELRALAQRLLNPERVAISINGGEATKLTPALIEASGMTPSDIIALCLEVVRHNYSDFIARFAGPIGQAQARLRQNPSGTSAMN